MARGKKGTSSDTLGTSSAVPLCRVLPQDIDAEAGLLGALLLDAGRVMEGCLAKGIVPEAFVEPAHRSIYIAIEKLAAKGQPIDSITVMNFLTAMGEAERVGGVKTLTALVNRTPTSAHAGYYADLVMEQYLRRTILGTVQKIESDIYDPSQSADYVLGTAEQAILGIGEGRHKSGSTADWRTTVNETLGILSRQLDKPGAISGLSTGFVKLDDMLRGMQRGAMVVLAARPAMGKTSLAMNIAECVARGRYMSGLPMPSEDGSVKKQTVLIFSLEMPQVQLTTRMMCGMADVSARDIERGFIKKAETLKMLKLVAKELAEMPIHCDDQGGLDVMELRARARHLHKKHPLSLIVVDYLQLLRHREFAKQGMQVEVSKVSGELKAMAKELNIPVLVLSQLSRNAENRGDDKPKNSDLRDSGAIEQDADVIMLLRRPCYMGSKAKESDDRLLAIVDVSKNRNGATGEVRLNFDGRVTRFNDRKETNPEYMQGDVVPVHLPPTPQEA